MKKSAVTVGNMTNMKKQAHEQWCNAATTNWREDIGAQCKILYIELHCLHALCSALVVLYKAHDNGEYPTKVL